jgi:succinate-semialdehyde dehydrogenase/glutarate-semialdehyde dehydrogenase
MKAINPATGETIQDHVEHDDTEVARRLEAAERAFATWRRRSFAERASIMRAAAQELRARLAHYARLMTLEMGKPIVAAEAEVEKCAGCLEFFAEHAERFLAPETIASDAGSSFVRHEPIGPVLALMPWNFPFWQVIRFAAPTLMAGNVGLLKHAANVPGCALAIEELLARAGAPTGVMTTLMIGSRAVAPVIAHPTVRAVTLTGSEAAGKAVAAAAGAALKKTVLELGGSDPFIVLADANLVEVAPAAAKARTINSGQSCIAAKRFIVEEPIAREFEVALSQAMEKLRVGDPMERATEVGPIARADLRDELHDQVERSRRAGARMLTGGKPLPGRGFYYLPTVLAQVTPGMPAFDEETFGPVAAVVRARNADECVALANRSRFGLGASIWTRDARRGEQLAAGIEAGQVFVNGIVKSDPRLPFGGVKDSGYGRELSRPGILEFVNIKTYWIK